MSLEKWQEYGWLKAEPTSRDEIKGLLTIIDRSLQDANVAAISDDLRFVAAFSASLTSATVALRAAGFRASAQPGHHLKTLESLEHTIHADPATIRRLRTLSKKRNATSYDSAGSVSKQDLELAIKAAVELQEAVISWIRKTHPELLKM